MSPLVTTIEEEAPRRASAEEIFGINAARETALSRLLMLYIRTGLFFMLLPGTFLGVWNLLAIDSSLAWEITAPPRAMADAAVWPGGDGRDSWYATTPRPTNRVRLLR